MSRLPRIIVPGHPHHVTQRGVRRMQTFFCQEDYECYIGIVATIFRRNGICVWSWCLMPNHTHMIIVPSEAEAVSEAMGEAHRRYAREVNARHGWTGRFWQGRFGSCVMSQAYTIRCARYIELNPVRSGLVDHPEKWPWSSARGNLGRREDPLVTSADLRDLVGDWRHFLEVHPSSDELEDLRFHIRTGRPLGAESFVRDMTDTVGPTLP